MALSSFLSDKIKDTLSHDVYQRYTSFKHFEVGKEFSGFSPPSAFVSSTNYPHVHLGLLSTPVKFDATSKLDDPGLWFYERLSIEGVLKIRALMINSRKMMGIRQTNKFLELSKEVVQSLAPVDLEIQLKRQPRFDFQFDSRASPIMCSGEILKARTTSNISVPREIDKIVSDSDMNANEAVNMLSDHGFGETFISNLLSVSLLGRRSERKLVPTRWSITATDSMLSNKLVRQIKTYEKLEEIRLFQSDYLGNYYQVLLLPCHYQYELIEMKMPGCVSKSPLVFTDFEPYFGRKTYAHETAGGFYATMLGAAEYLDKIKRQASVLVVRVVSPEYYAPLGVWVVRETVRGAFRNPYKKFDSLRDALKTIKDNLKLENFEWAKNSRLLKEYKQQATLNRFFLS